VLRSEHKSSAKKFERSLLGVTNRMVFFAYILKSVNHDFYYKGHCKDIEERLKQHNSGMTKSIVPYLPFIVIYFESFDSLEQAIRRERYFKSAAGRRFLKSKINNL
jgi:putative endonuclease